MTNCCNPNPCCDKPKCGNPCGCPNKVLSIETLTDMPGYVRFNLDGGSVLFDFSDIVHETETGTRLSVNQIARTLQYFGEDRINNISASQLGAILHLVDLGDVNGKGLKDNAILVYQKNSECGTSCGEIQNQWVAWAPIDHVESSIKNIMGFDDDGVSKALDTPTHADQFYNVMWRGEDKIGYAQPAQVSVPSTDGTYARLLFEHPLTHEVESFPVKVSIDNDHNVTFKAQGGA